VNDPSCLNVTTTSGW